MGVRFLTLLVAFVLATPAAAQRSSASAERSSATGDRTSAAATWRAGQVTALAFDSLALDRAFARAEQMVPITSLLIARDGVLARERYYLGLGPEQRVNIKSASKSILSALVGIALARGALDSVTQPVADFFPQYVPDDDPRRREITLEHLLSMQSGLETTSFRNYGRWVNSDNWVRWALRQPVECPPGTCWSYSTGSSHVVSAILTVSTGVSTLAFARRHLFEPIRVDLAAWERDPQGIYLGGNNMMLSPRELLAFGNLYLHGGRYAGRTVVPEQWIRQSWRRLGRSPWNGHHYGYGWWTREVGGHTVHFAWGYGGQYVFVVPSLRLVAVVTSALDRRRPRSHNRQIIRLLRDYIMPAVE